MSAATALPLIGGQVVQTAAVDNATATATVAAAPGATHIGLGIHADYSAAPAAGKKTITVKRDGVAILVFRHDFATGDFVIAFPGAVRGAHSGALSVELQASGTGGVTGRVTLFYISN